MKRRTWFELELVYAPEASKGEIFCVARWEPAKRRGAWTITRRQLQLIETDSQRAESFWGAQRAWVMKMSSDRIVLCRHKDGTYGEDKHSKQWIALKPVLRRGTAVGPVQFILDARAISPPVTWDS